MADVVVFDATADFDGSLTDELFAFMQERYWVCVYEPPTRFREKARFDSWIMCTAEPMPVPNRQMQWRRPTWEECLRFVRLPVDRPDLVERAREATARHGREYGHPWEWHDGALGGRFPRRVR